MSKIILGGFNLVDVGFTVGWKLNLITHRACGEWYNVCSHMFTHFLHVMFFLLMCTCTPSLSISPIHSGTRTCVNLFEPHRPDAVHTVVCTRSGGESVLFAVSHQLSKDRHLCLATCWLQQHRKDTDIPRQYPF